MKKRAIFVAIAIAAFSATLAISHAVNSQNWVGYAKVQVPPAGQFTMVGVNFEAVGGGGVPLNELISTNSLTSGMYPPQADSVYIYFSSKPESGEPGYKQYYFAGTGFKDADNIAGSITNPVVHKGNAFWLQSPLSASESNEVYVMGEVSLAETNTLPLITSFQQIANPYPVDFDLNSKTNWLEEGATGGQYPPQGDSVYVLDGTDYQHYFLGTNGQWKNAKEFGFPVATNAVIPTGQGAWYDAKGDYTATINRPFDVN